MFRHPDENGLRLPCDNYRINSHGITINITAKTKHMSGHPTDLQIFKVGNEHGKKIVKKIWKHALARYWQENTARILYYFRRINSMLVFRYNFGVKLNTLVSEPSSSLLVRADTSQEEILHGVSQTPRWTTGVTLHEWVYTLTNIHANIIHK